MGSTPVSINEWIVWIVLVILLPFAGYIGARLSKYLDQLNLTQSEKSKHDLSADDEIRRVMIDFLKQQMHQYQRVADYLEAQLQQISAIQFNVAGLWREHRIFLEKISRIEILLEVLGPEFSRPENPEKQEKPNDQS